MGRLVLGDVRRAAVALGRAAARWPLVVLVLAALATGAVVLHRPAGSPPGSPALRDVALGLACVAGLGLLGVPATVRYERLRRAGIAAVDVMPGTEFEQRLSLLFGSMGYRVRPTGGSGDYGADVVVEREGVRTVIQAKRYDGSVGIDAVQQVIGARRYYDADDAMVVTNSVCTRAARVLAEANGVVLVEREELIGLLAAQAGEVRRPSGLVLLCRQLYEGVGLVIYTLGCVLRLAGWLARSIVRPARATDRRRPGGATR